MKHTPGPWAVTAASFTEGNAVAYEIEADGMEISAGNAHLIAAAPDLYEALQLLVSEVAFCDAWQRPCVAIDNAIAALKKARGEA